MTTDQRAITILFVLMITLAILLAVFSTITQSRTDALGKQIENIGGQIGALRNEIGARGHHGDQAVIERQGEGG